MRVGDAIDRAVAGYAPGVGGHTRRAAVDIARSACTNRVGTCDAARRVGVHRHHFHTRRTAAVGVRDDQRQGETARRACIYRHVLRVGDAIDRAVAGYAPGVGGHTRRAAVDIARSACTNRVGTCNAAHRVGVHRDVERTTVRAAVGVSISVGNGVRASPCRSRVKIAHAHPRTTVRAAGRHTAGQCKRRGGKTNVKVRRACDNNFLHIEIHHIHRRHRHLAEVLVGSGNRGRDSRNIHIDAHRHLGKYLKIQGKNHGAVRQSRTIAGEIGIKPGKSCLIAHGCADHRCIAFYVRGRMAHIHQFGIVPVNAEIEDANVREVGHFYRYRDHVAAYGAGGAFCG
ncbi:MAG: hypothetical protein EPGJADBJ_04418 [Saprospiraceae bacterium]|nr:hypothetical protein [Saprospiraceae bacterium]